MNRSESGLYLKHLLEGVGIAALSGIALWEIPGDPNPLKGADKTTWLYRNLGPQGLKEALLWAFAALFLLGIWRVVANARNLLRRD